MKSKTSNRVLCGAAALLFAASTLMGAQSTKSYDQLKAEHPGWMQIPGKLIRPDCVHQVPSGAQIDLDRDGQPTGDIKMNGQVIAHYDSCPEQSIDTRHFGSQSEHDPGPTGNGWVEASQWELSLGASDDISFLAGYWHVPSPPNADGALVYLFNGIEPSGGGWIMQPVLQWGNNGGFGGNYYVFASWLVGPQGSGIAFVTNPMNVNVGDLLTGVNAQNGVSGNTLSYFVTVADGALGEQTTLNFTSQNLHWVWAYAGVLEAYNVTSCSQFPPNDVSHFYQTQVAHDYPANKFLDPEGFYGSEYDYFGNGGPQCNFSVSVTGNGVKAGSTSALNY